MRSILIPLDGSTFAERVLPLARSIARTTGARLELVAVHEPAWMLHGGGAPAVDQRLDAELRAELGRYLDRTKADVVAAEPDLGVDSVLLDGPVVESLVRHADASRSDLVVLSTHGRVGPSREWLGSVTDALVRIAGRPILVVPPADGSAVPPTTDVSRVVVALDGTPESEGALAVAAALAGARKVEFTLVRVVQPLHPLLRAVATQEAYDSDLREQRTEADTYLTRVAERLRASGLQVRSEVRVDPNVARCVVDCAAEWNADMIALATHGRGRIGRMLLGSVADKVLRAARGPVLLYHPALPTPEQQRAATASHAVRAVAAAPGTGDSGGAGVTSAAAVAGGADSAPAVALRRVLVATDFAAPSLRAATWTARHLLGDAELVLLHAIPMPKPPALVAQSVPAREQLVETTRRGAETRIRELSLGLGAGRIWPDVRIGVPTDHIVAAAGEYAADLIVIGEHGERTGLSRLLGSTVQQVVRGSRVPVLLGRNLADAPPRRVLIAIDESAETPYVIAWARLLATRCSAAIVALHVVSAPYSGVIPLGTASIDPQRTIDRVREDANRWLDDQVGRLRGEVGSLSTTIALGDPGPEILTAARSFAADLIIMGRGGAGRALAALAGSATEHVLRTGDGPVIIVTSPQDRSDPS